MLPDGFKVGSRFRDDQRSPITCTILSVDRYDVRLLNEGTGEKGAVSIHYARALILGGDWILIHDPIDLLIKMLDDAS